MRQIGSELKIELNEAEHGDSDTGSLEHFNPDVRKCRAQAVLAVDIVKFC